MLHIAFLIGLFPTVGLQALQRVMSRALRTVVPTVTSDYPLDQLDGFNLWYEARLTEEGVEDMHNLTTMNLVDVILHTRIPVGRLVDWIDRAFLLIHLGPTDRAELNMLRSEDRGAADRSQALSGARARVNLGNVGIRTATDVLKMFSAELDEPSEAQPRRVFRLPAGLASPLPADQLRLLVSVLAVEPGLVPVWNWQKSGLRRYPHQIRESRPQAPGSRDLSRRYQS